MLLEISSSYWKCPYLKISHFAVLWKFSTECQLDVYPVEALGALSAQGEGNVNFFDKQPQQVSN